MSKYRNAASNGRHYVHFSDDGTPTTDANSYVQFIDANGNLYTDIDTLGAKDLTVYVEDDGVLAVGYTIHEVARSGDNVASPTTGSTSGTNANTPDAEPIANFGASLMRVEITSNENNLVYVEVVTK